MKVLVKEALGYAVASAVALAVDMSLLWMLVRFAGYGYMTAGAIAFLAGAGVAYALSVRIAFKQHRLEERRKEFAGFVAIGIMGLGINSGAIFLGVTVLGLHYLMAKCIAASLTFSCNFALRRQLLFTRRPFA
jgi:putative flippase GtrA